MNKMRQCMSALYEQIASHKSFQISQEALIERMDLELNQHDGNEHYLTYHRDVLLSDIQQTIDAQTLTRSQYYIQRLLSGITAFRVNNNNDINLNRWKEYDHIFTDSLWLIDHRDRSSEHTAEYWGNFIPQIPYQMLIRYTKAGEWVLDPFLGSGTTLIECKRLGRHGIGIELNPKVATEAKNRLEKTANPKNVITEIFIGDCLEQNYPELLRPFGIHEVQLIIFHPPYHDIIKFSNDARDLSNKSTIDDFITSVQLISEMTYAILAEGRYCVLIIGDKYMQREWIPLGFDAMQAVMRVGYKLKSIIVKNYDQTKGKREQTQLWRYRALVGGFYIFKHEYIFVFQK